MRSYSDFATASLATEEREEGEEEGRRGERRGRGGEEGRERKGGGGEEGVPELKIARLTHHRSYQPYMAPRQHGTSATWCLQVRW